MPLARRGSATGRVATAAWVARAAGGVRRAADRFRPDVVHANTLTAACACIAAPGRAGRTSLVAHARDRTIPPLFARMCSRGVSRVVAISGFVRRALIDADVPARKIAVVPNGVDLADVRPAAGPSRRGVFVVANVGQFVPWKNQELFLDLADALARSCSDVEFVLVGDDLFGRDGSWADRIRRRAASGAAGVKLTGWVADMTGTWRGADCLVHTAIGEPFGRVVIEAMAAGLPVVALRSGAMEEIVVDGRTGFLVDVDDREGLVERTRRLVEDRSLAAAMGRAGRLRVLARYTADRTAAGVARIYRELTGRA